MTKRSFKLLPPIQRQGLVPNFHNILWWGGKRLDADETRDVGDAGGGYRVSPVVHTIGDTESLARNEQQARSSPAAL